jgi:hypothetical protein
MNLFPKDALFTKQMHFQVGEIKLRNLKPESPNKSSENSSKNLMGKWKNVVHEKVITLASS